MSVRFQFNRMNKSGLNFINVLRTAFTLVDPKSVKNTVKSSVSFYSFGICRHKNCTESSVSFYSFGICRHKNCTENVDKIEPRCQFYQHFTSSFLFESIFHSFSLLIAWLCILDKEYWLQKLLVKCW